jgi:polyisoprenoid-binding protein YceI
MTAAESANIAIPTTGRYTIDPASSSIRFDTRHMFGLGGVHGTFGIDTGSVEVTDPVGDSSASVDIDAASFATGNNGRDTTVRSAKFLDADNHPAIQFRGDGVRQTGDGWQLTGTLTVRGAARPVALDVTEVSGTNGTLSARATCHIDRYEFGIDAMRGMAGRHLTMSIEINAVRG